MPGGTGRQGREAGGVWEVEVSTNVGTREEREKTRLKGLECGKQMMDLKCRYGQFGVYDQQWSRVLHWN